MHVWQKQSTERFDADHELGVRVDNESIERLRESTDGVLGHRERRRYGIERRTTGTARPRGNPPEADDDRENARSDDWDASMRLETDERHVA